jgi:hypothetical protein
MEAKKYAIMEAHLGVNLESKLDVIFDDTLEEKQEA